MAKQPPSGLHEEVRATTTAAPLTDPNDLRTELPAQLTSPVRWTECVRYMIAQGVTTFIELGSKDVLTTLLKRIDANVKGLEVGTPEQLAVISPTGMLRDG